MSPIAVAGDSLLAAACAFTLIFTAVRYYTKNPALGLGLGCAAFALFGALAFVRLSAARGAAIEHGKNRGKKKAFATYLCSLGRDEATALLAEAMDGRATGDGAVCGDRLYLPVFMPEALSPDDLCEAARLKTDKKITAICNGATDEAVRFAAMFGIEMKFCDEIYDRLCERGAEPDVSAFAERARPAPREILKRAIKRSNARRLFWCGLWLTAFSYFTFFPVYYIVSGGIILVLAAVCAVFGTER